MNVLSEEKIEITEAERFDPLWLKIEALLRKREEKLINMLIAKESEETRGRIKEVRFLLSPPGETHTAKVHPRVSADEEGFHE
jgi:hypothetical protein